MVEEIDSTTNLLVKNRKLTDHALSSLIKNETCSPVTLDKVRPDISFRRAVGVVISSRGRNDRNDGGALYFITDMCGHISKLYLSAAARKHFGSKSDEGALVYLINPIVQSNTDNGYMLVFFVERQQDVVVVGNCATFGRCSGTRKDGKPCNMPINTQVTNRCPHHPENVLYRNPKSQFVFIKDPDDTSQVSTHARGEGSAVTAQATTASKDIQRSQAIGNQHPGVKTTCPTAALIAPGDAFAEAMSTPTVTTTKGPTVPLYSTEGAVSTADIDLEDVHDEVRHAVIVPPRDIRFTGRVPVPQESSIFSCSNRVAASQATLPPSRRGEQMLTVTRNPLPSTNSLLTKPSTSDFGKSIHIPTAKERWGTSNADKRSISGVSANKAGLLSTADHRGDVLQTMGCGGAHSMLLNVTSLHRNAAAAAVASKRPLSQDGSGRTKVPRKGVENMATDEKLAELLNRESSHAEEADNEWFDGFQQRMSRLEKQEAKALAEEEIKSVSVRASQCLTCGSLTEYALDLCKKQGHSIQMVHALKRFYECRKCGRRDSTLGSKLVPKHRCPKCHNHDWIACGKNKTGYIVGSRDYDTDNRLVVSLSADTTRKEFNRVAAVTSLLDNTAQK